MKFFELMSMVELVIDEERIEESCCAKRASKGK